MGTITAAQLVCPAAFVGQLLEDEMGQLLRRAWQPSWLAAEPPEQEDRQAVVKVGAWQVEPEAHSQTEVVHSAQEV
jgi:hypothetical protein